MSHQNINRRGFLGVSLAATVPVFLCKSVNLFAGDTVGSDDILVVVQLSGGNDGISTVVPHGDDAYHRNRGGLRVEGALKINEYCGLHPNLDKLMPIYKDGKMAIIQGASYPNPNRSHFKAMDIWHTGDKRGRGINTGWLGRAIDSACPKSEDPNLVVNVGNSVPYCLRGDLHKPVSFERTEDYKWRGRMQDKDKFDKVNEKQEGMSNLDWLHRTASNARMSSGELRRAAAKYRPKVKYPSGFQQKLAPQMKTIASLITGGLKTRVYYVSMGGFDTHVRQKQPHDNLMRGLGDGIAAFLADLKAQGCSKRVVVMAFSEFGRRVKSNASGGTDHGVAGPMFLFGDRVKGGLYGKHPSLTDLDQGDLKMTCDFRQVYATVLDDWLKTSSEKVLGAKYDKFDLIS